MSVHQKPCRNCAQPIELRRGDDGRWRPFDPDGRPHDCPLRPPALPAVKPARASAAPAGRWSWLLLPLILAALLFARSGGTNDDAPGELAPEGALATTAPSAAARVPSAVARLPNGGCSRFGNQVWAQSVYDADPVVNGDLDPDRIGRACDILPPGAAPALWTGSIPRGVEQVALLNAIDGDTIRVRRGDGAVELVRLVGVDTPETGQGTRALECYGPEATDFTTELLGRADGVIYLEQDRENRDRYGRLLRYVWFEDADGVYLVNEAIVRAGYGERFRDTPNRRYLDRLVDAEEFARRHDYGLWAACA